MLLRKRMNNEINWLCHQGKCAIDIHQSSSSSLSFFSIGTSLGNSFLLLSSSRAISLLSQFSSPQDHVENQGKESILHKHKHVQMLIKNNFTQMKAKRVILANDLACHVTWQQHRHYCGSVWDWKKMLQLERQAMDGTGKAVCNQGLSARLIFVSYS